MPMLNGRWLAPLLSLCVLLGGPLLAAGGHGIDGTTVALWMAIPFAGILLSIAIFPLVAPHFWHHHFGKIAAAWGALGVLFLLLGTNFDVGNVLYEIVHIVLLDYVPFIILLLGLFVIAGGIRIKGTMRGSPKLNTIMLLIGTLIASWMGTTGAAMLMVRPLIKANAWRKNKVHIIIFFIFLVCNIGGSLTPLGDPPLFLGFLRGVEFTWTFNLLPPMLLATVVLLSVFFVFDTVMLKREEHQAPPVVPGEVDEKFGIEGAINFLLLAGLIGVILLSSTLGKGALYDQEKADAFNSVIAQSERRAYLIEVGLKNVLEPERASAELDLAQLNLMPLTQSDAFRESIKNAKPLSAYRAALELHDMVQNAEHALGLHEGHDDHAGHDHDAVPTAGEGGAAASHDDHEGGGHGLQRSNLEQRIAAIEAGKVDDEVKKFLLRDYQHAVMATNNLRTTQSYKATLGLPVIGMTLPWANVIRDVVILFLAVLSWKITSRESRKKNGFTWFPIVEVAKLFAGIFICIIPALKILQAGVDGQLAGLVNMVTNPDGSAIDTIYFWMTGFLSSFLDNAPTYLVFFNTAGGDPNYLMGEGYHTLMAISLGAVFMGANTYIGNAPNFMVKAIAEESDIPMPSFFGYMIWSVAILVPLFLIITFIIPVLPEII